LDLIRTPIFWQQKGREKGLTAPMRLRVGGRVARWFVFKPNIPIWVNFRGPYVDWEKWICFMAIWDIL
jgi:hypothetical protein